MISRPLRVGDVVFVPGDKIAYVISRLEPQDRTCYARMRFSDGTVDEDEQYFGAITSDCMPTSAWDKVWCVEERILPPSPIDAYSSTDWRAWRDSDPSHCACGIDRRDCAYHR